MDLHNLDYKLDLCLIKWLCSEQKMQVKRKALATGLVPEKDQQDGDLKIMNKRKMLSQDMTVK